MRAPSYGTLPVVRRPEGEAPPRGLALGLGVVLAGCCVAAVVVGVGSSGPAAARGGVGALAFDAAAGGDVCLVHVAAGDAFEAVSEYTLPTKRAYAAANGYRVLHYADAPTCCDDATSVACGLTNVAYKYCALRDAFLTGGAAAAGGNAAGAACAWVFATDGDALFTPDAPPLESLVPERDLAASQTVAVVSAGRDAATDDVTTSTLEQNFNSGATLWRTSADALRVVEAVLAFDDASYDGEKGSACDCSTVGGCGDQWALCGAGAADPSLFDGFLALRHPDLMQRALLFNDGAIVPVSVLDWPPVADERAFVVNCAGNDPLGCVRYMTHFYYPDATDPLPKLKDDMNKDPYKPSLQKPDQA